MFKYLFNRLLFNFMICIEEGGDKGLGSNIDFKSIFGDDPPPEPTGDGDKGAQKGDGDPKPNPEVEKLQKQVEKLTNDYKNQNELLRQKAEENKELKGFFDAIKGKLRGEDQQKSELELRQRFEEDALSVIDEKIKNGQTVTKKEVNDLKESIRLMKAENTVRDHIKEINREYEVDWNNPKIKERIALFSDKARAEMPKEVLLSAARMADALKPRSETGIPYIEGNDGYGPQTKGKSIVEKEKEAILKASPPKLFND